VRDHHIPWLDVEKVDLADQLRVHCRASGTKPARKISAWSVHYSRRKVFAADAKARRAAARGDRPQRFSIGGMSTLGMPQSAAGRTATDPVSDEAQAERVVHLLNERAEAARAEQAAATPAGVVTSNWSRDAIAALVIPAIILLICCLA